MFFTTRHNNLGSIRLLLLYEKYHIYYISQHISFKSFINQLMGLTKYAFHATYFLNFSTYRGASNMENFGL